VVERVIVGVGLKGKDEIKYLENKEMIDKMIGKIKNLGMELQRYDPTEWNAFMEICLAGAAGDS
jgi:hypothetical protein